MHFDLFTCHNCSFYKHKRAPKILQAYCSCGCTLFSCYYFIFLSGAMYFLINFRRFHINLITLTSIPHTFMFVTYTFVKLFIMQTYFNWFSICVQVLKVAFLSLIFILFCRKCLYTCLLC